MCKKFKQIHHSLNIFEKGLNQFVKGWNKFANAILYEIYLKCILRLAKRKLNVGIIYPTKYV